MGLHFDLPFGTASGMSDSKFPDYQGGAERAYTLLPPALSEHEALTTLRARGGSLADMAILIVDVMENFMPPRFLNFLTVLYLPI